MNFEAVTAVYLLRQTCPHLRRDLHSFRAWMLWARSYTSVYCLLKGSGGLRVATWRLEYPTTALWNSDRCHVWPIWWEFPCHYLGGVARRGLASMSYLQVSAHIWRNYRQLRRCMELCRVAATSSTCYFDIGCDYAVLKSFTRKFVEYLLKIFNMVCT